MLRGRFGVNKMTFVDARPWTQRLWPFVLAFMAAIGLGLPLSGGPATAQPVIAAAHSPAPIVVGNDLGGDVGARANRIAALAATGRPVEIRGAACYSACTLYLGLPGTCISRKTQFGFHRPSFYGAALPPEKFEFWSQVIAAHYPPALREWYLREGRFSARLRKISGGALIAMGLRECG